MKTKPPVKNRSLMATNPYLKDREKALKSIIRNAASSTAIETGKPASTYISRCANLDLSFEKSDPKPRKK